MAWRVAFDISLARRDELLFIFGFSLLVLMVSLSDEKDVRRFAGKVKVFFQNFLRVCTFE